jgi:O-antigen/teichoic acid export membrane protein
MLQRLMKGGSVGAIADQVVVSAGNFATTLLLARALAPAEFGTFVLINSACQIMIGFHGNLVVSPLVVLGASASATKYRTYPTAALAFTLTLLPVSFLVVFLASASLHREVTGLLAVFYILAWQFQETTRRALTSKLRYGDAIWGDSISYLGQALLVGLMFRHPGSTLNEAFTIMAAATLGAAVLQCWQAKAALMTWTELCHCGVEFWALGKWMIVVSLTSVAAGPLFPWFLNWFHGKEAVASYQAAMNVLGLANPLVISISAIVMPTAANWLNENSLQRSRSLYRLAMRYVLQFELLLAPWLLVLLVWPHNALIAFYGKTTLYGGQTAALRVGILVYVLTVPMTVFGAVLTGTGKTKSNAAMQVVGAAASLVCAPPLILTGGVVGTMLAETVARGSRVWYAARSIRQFSAINSIKETHTAEGRALKA